MESVLDLATALYVSQLLARPYMCLLVDRRFLHPVLLSILNFVLSCKTHVYDPSNMTMHLIPIFFITILILDEINCLAD